MPASRIMNHLIVAVATMIIFTGSMHATRRTTPGPVNAIVGDRSFIERFGNICAVGYLVEQPAGRGVAEAINGQFQYAAIGAMDSPELRQWLAASGLTLAEATMIQPTYGAMRKRALEDEELRRTRLTLDDSTMAAAPRGTILADTSRHVSSTFLAGISTGIGIAIHAHMHPPEELRRDVSPVGIAVGINPGIAITGTWFLAPGQRSNAIIARIGYNDMSFTLRRPASDIIFIDRNGEVRTTTAQYQIATDYKLIMADLLWSHRLWGSSFALLAGPSLGVVIAEERVDAHIPDVGFATGYWSGATSKPFRLGVKGGLQYSVRTGTPLGIIPTLLYDFGLTSVKEGEPWRADMLQIGIDFHLLVN